MYGSKRTLALATPVLPLAKSLSSVACVVTTPEAPHIEQPFEHRNRERSTRARLGAAADLINEHERTVVRHIEHLAHAGQVRGERRCIERDRLLVADICDDAA